MKRYITALTLVIVLALTVLLVSCGGGGAPADTGNGEEDERELAMSGDRIILFGAKDNSNFDIIYEPDTCYDMANELYLAVKAKGYTVSMPKSSAVAEENKFELLIGDTGRALSSEAKAAVEQLAAADSVSLHWAFIYRDAQFAVYASSERAYEKAYDSLISKYFSGGEFKVPKNESYKETLKPHEAYMSYDIPNNFYDGYEDPFGIGEFTEITLIASGDSTYNIEYTADNGDVYRTQLVKKKWGMWMLGKMEYVHKDGRTVTMTPSSTEYELVLNCGTTADTITWRGGGHGDYSLGSSWDANDSSKSNDRLLDMTFYDAKTGEKVELSTGERITLNGLRVVIHNNIYEGEYLQENVLVNVEKSYLFTGYDVLCDSKLYVTRETMFHRSYSCMLPNYKDYGNSIMCYTPYGTVYMKTATEGNGKDAQTFGIDTTKIDTWGEKNPAYHITVELLNPEDMYAYTSSKASDKRYFGVRDMKGNTQNKMYFSNFTSNPTVMPGEEFNYRSKWSFSYQPDFVNPDREPNYYVHTN